MFRFVIVSLLSLSAAWTQASAVYMDVQSGSLLGVGHASVGKAFASKHHLLAGLGYVPDMKHHREMALGSVRYQFQGETQWAVGDRGWVVAPFRLGVGVLVSNHDDLFLELPEQYPDDYYTPTALRIIFNYQASLKFTASTSAYFDLSVLDVGLLSYVREPEFFLDNYDYLGLEGVTNLGFGLRHQF